MPMNSDILFTDKYVEVTSSHVNVNYDSHIENIDLADVQSVELFTRRSNWRITLRILGACLIVFSLATILLGLTNDRAWEYVPSLSNGIALLVIILSNRDEKWTLVLKTAPGPVNILTSTSWIYLSKVKRAINKALKSRSGILTRR